MCKKTKQDILYFPLNCLLHFIALMPFWILYGLADFLFVLVYYVVGYRVKVARKNVAESFPELSKKEQNRIVRKFYRHLADYFVETIKLLHISDKTMKKRMVFTNVEAIEKSLANGKSIAVFLGHYGNWEYIPSITLWADYDKSKAVFTQIYRRLNNDWFDRFFLKLRSRFHSVSFEKHSTLRGLLKMKHKGLQTITGFISDQHPTGGDYLHVINFLNHETTVITGSELLATRMGMDVLYFDIRKVKRGHYIADTKVISTDSKNEAQYAITDTYTTMLEESIKRQPELWLWTHKRWKYSNDYDLVEKKTTEYKNHE